jgi:regulator of replication initiation timing
MTSLDQQIEELIKERNAFEVENETLKTQLSIANSILKKNLEWVRCGIGGNCSGYPKDHPDYLLQLNYLEAYQ